MVEHLKQDQKVLGPTLNSAQLYETIPNRNSKISPYDAILEFLIGAAYCCYLISSYCTIFCNFGISIWYLLNLLV